MNWINTFVKTFFIVMLIISLYTIIEISNTWFKMSHLAPLGTTVFMGFIIFLNYLEDLEPKKSTTFIKLDKKRK